MWKEHKFRQQKNRKKWLLQKKKLFNIDDFDINKILVSKKEPYGKKMHLNTLLDIMITMLLDHYV